MERHSELTNFIWSIADLLRHDYKQSEKVRSEYDRYKDKIDNIGPLLENAAKHSFYNISQFDFEKLLADPTNVANAFKSYIGGFSPRVVQRFAQIDLHPETIDNVRSHLRFPFIASPSLDNAGRNHRITPRSGPTGGQNGLARPFRTIRSPSEPSRSIRYCPSISTTLDRYGRFSMDSRNSKNGALLTT